MDQLDPTRIAATILAASPVTLLSLTTRSPHLRQHAAERLAHAIIAGPDQSHPDQLRLPLV